MSKRKADAWAFVRKGISDHGRHAEKEMKSGPAGDPEAAGEAAA